MTKPGEFSPDVVELIWIRDGGACVDCGMPQVRERRGEAFGGWSIQHREARGAGGTSKGAVRKNARPWLVLASNGAVMCGTGVTGCHGRAETKDRRRAFDLGFAVRPGVRRPAEMPIRHALHGWVTLTDDGDWEPAEAPEEEAIAA
ncbi:hypothetical protein [Microbacterium allomyrinae]|uniref:HNH endonuclease n=1 Tax=Microbacterium allomyrinae TaxID=2830666 RepID=A0A9X1S0I4_9MICO|nr:hypothetical protein [Microbacterium allomyrinae]MCC2030641.1 hypothetical protein [Microbacterium allomyrinae]